MATAVTETSKEDHWHITKLCGTWGSTPKLIAVAEIDAERALGLDSPYLSGGFEILAVRDPKVPAGVFLRTAPSAGPKWKLENLPDC